MNIIIKYINDMIIIIISYYIKYGSQYNSITMKYTHTIYDQH